jgi:phosphoribosylformylglycinamidine cyclo-ligase
MGHRFELYVPEEVVDDLIEISESFNVKAQVVGHVEAAPTKELLIQTAMGSFEYH